KPENIKILSEEYVFDAKFVDEGKITYIVENKDMEKNLFFLYILDKSGKEIKKIQVSGSRIALSPNGKTGYIGGPFWEKINFVENQIEKGLFSPPESNSEKEKVFQTIRQAINILYKFELSGEKDRVGAKKYFIDTNSPDQWAYFDIINYFNTTTFVNSSDNLYIIGIKLEDLIINVEEHRAFAKVRVNTLTSSGGESSMDYALELVENDNEWYVTGLSTFPDSQMRNDLEKIIKEYVSESQKGKIFPGELEGKEVEIGQIQFWTSSLPVFAADVKNADYCKVYLKVKYNGKQEIYKMVLDKKNQSYWKPVGLSRGNLSGI
ncbi:MAG: hypothetical protein ACOYJ1_00255, partial [Peptococcales bacterium]